jgi:hypothetical protein
MRRICVNTKLEVLFASCLSYSHKFCREIVFTSLHALSAVEVFYRMSYFLVLINSQYEINDKLSELTILLKCFCRTLNCGSAIQLISKFSMKLNQIIHIFYS